MAERKRPARMVARAHRAIQSARRYPLHVRDDSEVAAAFEHLAGQPDIGLLVPSDAFTYFRSAMIVALAAKYPLLAIYPYRRFAEEGDFAAYGVDAFEQMRSAASYVDRNLKAAKPVDLPVQTPTKDTLIINLKTARRLGSRFHLGYSSLHTR
jgi:putative ABC transport system substrate-binding protein